MKSSLRSTLAVVVLILAGTFVTVRGYLESQGSPQGPWEAAATTPGRMQLSFPFPAYLRSEVPADPAELPPTKADCPTC